LEDNIVIVFCHYYKIEVCNWASDVTSSFTYIL